MCSLVENEIAHNDMKQRFSDKDNYHTSKKLYISNLELPYPNIRIRLHKSLKIQSKEKL